MRAIVTCGAVAIGLAATLPLGWAPPAVAQTRTEMQVSVPHLEVDYWSGSLPISGTVTPADGGPQPISTSIAVKIWIADDGVARLKADDCVSALLPLDAESSLEAGGRFREDLARAGSAPDCGMNPGDKELAEVFQISRQGDALKLAYSYLWTFTQPYAGTGQATGEAVLPATFKQAPKPPAPPPVQVAAAAPPPPPAPVQAAPRAVAAAPALPVYPAAPIKVGVADKTPIAGIPATGKKTWSLSMRLDAIDNLGVVYISDVDKSKHKPILLCSWQPMLPGSGSIMLDPYIVEGVHQIDVMVYDQETAGMSAFFTAGKWAYDITFADREGALWRDSGTGPTTRAGVVFAKRFLVERTSEGALIVYPTERLPEGTDSHSRIMALLDDLYGSSIESMVSQYNDMVAGHGNQRDDFFGVGASGLYRNINC